MIVIGLTGTIASGKTTAANYFKQLGGAVISADDISRRLTEPNKPLFKAIVNHFGTDILVSTGILNRKKLRNIILSDPKEKIWLETLLHPAIRSAIESEVSRTQGPYCMIEIPLLNDKTHYPYLNRVLLITANYDIQLKRLTHRDQCTLEEAKCFLDTQLTTDLRHTIADDIIKNNSTPNDFLAKIKTYHERWI